jgi:WD40 repeat protein
MLVATGFWVAQHPEVADCGLTGATISHESSNNVRRIGWLPDGDRLLTQISGGMNCDRRLILHELAGACRELRVELAEEFISSMVISSDGQHVLVGTFSGRLWWINLDSSEQSLLMVQKTAITSAALSNDGRLAAVADDRGRVVLCPIRSDEATSTTFSEYEDAGTAVSSVSKIVVLAQNLGTSCHDIRFSEADDRLLCAGNDGSIRLWDVHARQLLQTFRGCSQLVTAVAFLPGNNRIISACLDDTIRIWDVASGHETWRGQFECLGIFALALSPDGKSAAWGGFSGKIQVWNLEQGQMEFVINSSVSTIWSLQFSPDGKSLAAAGRDGAVRIYDTKSGAQRHEIPVDVI